MLGCRGAVDDVFSYEKMKHHRGNESPAGREKFSDSAPQSPTSRAKLGGEKTSSFRWIYQHIIRVDGITLGGSKRVGRRQDAKEDSSASRKRKDPPASKQRIGFIDILMGYHSLLQAGAAYPVARQRRELHPTIGFMRNQQQD